MMEVIYSNVDKINNENKKIHKRSRISSDHDPSTNNSNISTMKRSFSTSIPMPLFEKQNTDLHNTSSKQDEKKLIINRPLIDNYNDENNNEWFTIFKSGVYPFGKKKWPAAANFVLLTIMFLILSGELLLSQQTSNEFLELDPFNYMLGPSIQILIETGARYSPCMRPIESMPANESYVCLNTTLPSPTVNSNNNSNEDLQPIPATRILHRIYDLTHNNSGDSNNYTNLPLCTLQDICGMSGFVTATKPDQSFRFFTPIFVHAGVFHYIINAIIHWFWAMDVERMMNPIRYSVVYILSGVFGNIFGANFATATNPYMGSSTPFFGILGCYIIDILYMWPQINQPFKHLIKTVVFIAFSFILGLLPGVDNFTHIGGLIGGLCIGASTTPAVYYSKTYRYSIWTARLIGLVLYITLTIVLLKAFYQGDGPDKYCTFCRYLSCIPIGGFCD